MFFFNKFTSLFSGDLFRTVFAKNPLLPMN